ncbi:tRNA ligase [Coniosporium apollinis]|uniref:tRNA ligase n=1 Tax=Coniosporium apollinis TaxID=61459 RepID=A0ABQ9P1W4_9PEZI|nr:tRNA ligase [Coniosporium apollinis]
MAHRQNAPFIPQNPQEIQELVQALESHKSKGKGRGGFSVKKATFTLPSGRTVDSWRMLDWDYKKPNLPTYARGLFTYVNQDGKYEIAVRGYDKFFNHGEVRKTEWSNVEKNTRGPYELSVKENGCIIFIAGLDDGTLLVCSKHSTGPREDADQSHAIAGERWIDKQLKAIGRTREDLARKLREMNATAVAELCDDAFEEHVLAYNPESAGLYLHGINLNLPEFVTYPHHILDRFATEWGFKKTMYVMEDDIRQVKSFLDKVAETGAYAGRETEGFVIRCQSRNTPDSPWEDWFFKYKFEEPYLMYRQWRECTKAIIAGRPPKYKKHKKITEEYLQYARKRLARDPQLGKAYNQNHGIIKLRNDFLQERGLKGSDIIREEIESGEGGSTDVKKNVVLVPVATIGCGKTTLAIALSKLFDWGHFQNDNVQGKGRRPQRFVDAVCKELGSHPVVIADRNNHQRREREQLIKDVSQFIPDARFVALHYVHDRSNYDQIRKALRERVLNRGDNHQTIQAVTKGADEVITIMEGFLERFEPVYPDSPPDDAFDLVINLDPTASSRENLETVVSQLNSEYPKLFDHLPTGDELDAAIEAALSDYKPDIKHDLSFKKNENKGGPQKRLSSQPHANGRDATPRQPKLEYFAVRLPSQRINAILDAIFRNQDPETAKFYRHLQQSRRIQPEFHVTLIHRASSNDHAEMWSRLTDLHTRTIESVKNKENGSANAPSQPSEPELGKCKVQLERLVWDERVMCFVVRLLQDEYETVNPVAHVTVGTASSDIKPKESNTLLQKWLSEGSNEENRIKEITVRGHVVLDGSVRGVLQKF